MASVEHAGRGSAGRRKHCKGEWHERKSRLATIAGEPDARASARAPRSSTRATTSSRRTIDELRARGLLAAACRRELGGEGMEARRAGRDAAAPWRTPARAPRSRSPCTRTWSRWRRGAGSTRRRRCSRCSRRWRATRGADPATGGGDWLDSSGEAVAVDGGFRVTARKSFCSGVPAGNILVHLGGVRTRTKCIHFAVPLKAEGVRIEPTWQTMGMRNTGVARRGAGERVRRRGRGADAPAGGQVAPAVRPACLFSLPLVYCGVPRRGAGGARARARDGAQAQARTSMLLQEIGEMENQLAAGAARARRLDRVRRGRQAGPRVDQPRR